MNYRLTFKRRISCQIRWATRAIKNHSAVEKAKQPSERNKSPEYSDVSLDEIDVSPEQKNLNGQMLV